MGTCKVDYKDFCSKLQGAWMSLYNGHEIGLTEKGYMLTI
jgi:hypothetical protein